MWNRMPYQKRWSTPTTVQQTEESLVIGYWLGIKANIDTNNGRPKDLLITIRSQALCEKHQHIIDVLENQAIEQRNIKTTPPPPPPDSLAPVTNGNVNTLPPLPAISEPPTMTTIIEPLSSTEKTEHSVNERSYPCPLCHKAIKAGEVHAC